MLIKVCLSLIIILNYLSSFSRAGYHYFGVRNVNQVEPPSLESAGIILSEFPEESQHRTQINVHQRPNTTRRPHQRSLSHSSQNNAIIAEAPSQKGGWRVISRSLANKKCATAPISRSLIEPPQTRVMAEPPKVRMLERRKEETPLQVIQRVHMAAQEGDLEEKDLKPNLREKIETYTETYLVTTYKTRVKTRKRLFVQQRRIVNQKVNKPVMIIRRKMVKEKQIYERIIPKIIETREIVNHPSVQSRVIEGPVVEVTPAHKPKSRALPYQNPTTGCPTVEIVGDSVEETMDGDAAVMASDTGYNYIGKK